MWSSSMLKCRGGKGSFDFRFAMPTRHFSMLEDHIYPTDFFPFATAASRDLLYLAAHGFWTVMAVSLLQAAALAPLVPLADALSLTTSNSRSRRASTRGSRQCKG